MGNLYLANGTYTISSGSWDVDGFTKGKRFPNGSTVYTTIGYQLILVFTTITPTC
ncbi:hypothetical protein [Hymenobacter monticola]|uniref:hypothetical protein n=1 Tax=Hymenobacter monticola TaxID=1705399 RepID=UPI0036D40D93